MKPFRPDAILLVVATPVDLLTSIAQRLSGLPPSQVLGSGTFLDSVRLRGLVADRAGASIPVLVFPGNQAKQAPIFQVAVDSIHLNVLGVHGESQVAAWSAATIGGSPIDYVLKPESAVRHAELEQECKDRPRSVIRAKGATPYGIGSAAASICASILLNECSVRPVSHLQPDYGCCFSLPATIGRAGIVSTIRPHLNREEEAAIASSAKELRATLMRVLEDSH